MGRPPQAFAQDSTLANNLANLLTGDAVQALNHKDVNGVLQHLKLIGIQTHNRGTYDSKMDSNPNNPSSCVASAFPIQTLSRGVHYPNNPSPGVVSTSAIQTFSRMVRSPNNPNSCIASTLAIQRLNLGVPNPNNPNSGVAPTSAIQTMHFQASVPR